MLYYGLVDEPDLDRWQAGLIARTEPTPSVVRLGQVDARPRARALFPPARAVAACDQGRPGHGEVRRAPPLGRGHQLDVHGEEARRASLYTRAMYRLKSRRLSATTRKRLLAAVGIRRSPKAVFSVRGKIRAHQELHPRPAEAARRRVLVFAIRLRAEMNPTRTSSLVSKPFAVGKP